MDPFDQLSINSEQGVTLAHQIKLQLTWLIVSGKLKAGDRLPPVRELADRLAVNLHTVRNAYRMLESEGLLDMCQGRGTHVLPFDPNYMFQRVSAQRTHTVGVILPNLTNPFYHSFLQGIEEMTFQDHSLLFVCASHEDRGEAMRYFAQLASKQVDGIILASHDPAPYLAKSPAFEDSGPIRMPLVSVDWPGAACASILLDLENAGYQATQHLIEHGHRHIGLVTFAEESANVIPVNQGYQRALSEAGIEMESSLIARVPGFDSASGAAGGRRLLMLPQPPTAIFAIADMLAIGVLQVIKQAGLRVPQDIALTSFNNIALASQVEPPLTTVNAPSYLLGIKAMQMLHTLMAGQSPNEKTTQLMTTLVIRQSCGCSSST
jgi:DNA-binding LacI/PurR family transcriptional regulator